MSFPAYGAYKASDVDWIGVVPEHWNVTRLKNLFEIRKRIAGTDDYDVLSITQRGLKVKDVDSNDGQVSMDYTKYQLVYPGDYAMNHMDLLTGYVDLSAQIGVTSPDYRVFALRNCASNPQFYLYLLQNAYHQKLFYPYGQGSSQLGRWRLPAEQFNEFLFPVPSVAEQADIVGFLQRETAKIDELVEEQQRLIELLKEKRQAIITHAVTKGLNPDAPMKPSGIEWPIEIPSAWEILPLTRVVEKFVDYRGKTPNKTDEGVPLVTASAIKNGAVNHELDPVFISEEEYGERMTRGYPTKGDVLLTTEAPLGEVAQIDDENVALGQRIILMKVDKDYILADYLFQHFRSQFAQNELWKRASGSTASGIRADRLRGSPVLVPPINEQVELVSFIKFELQRFEGIEDDAQRLIELLRERRRTLISAAVTGKIDVRGLASDREAA